jgi:lipopolysaccharide export LptBFGC system permease protein LptF
MSRSTPAARQGREKRRPVRPAGPIFIALTLLVVVLLAANLFAFYVLHPPPAVSLLALVALGLALYLLSRYRRQTIDR